MDDAEDEQKLAILDPTLAAADLSHTSPLVARERAGAILPQKPIAERPCDHLREILRSVLRGTGMQWQFLHPQILAKKNFIDMK